MKQNLYLFGLYHSLVDNIIVLENWNKIAITHEVSKYSHVILGPHHNDIATYYATTLSLNASHDHFCIQRK